MDLCTHSFALLSAKELLGSSDDVGEADIQPFDPHAAPFTEFQSIYGQHFLSHPGVRAAMLYWERGVFPSTFLWLKLLEKRRREHLPQSDGTNSSSGSLSDSAACTIRETPSPPMELLEVASGGYHDGIEHVAPRREYVRVQRSHPPAWLLDPNPTPAPLSTTVEPTQERRRRAKCASCHTLMDPGTFRMHESKRYCLGCHRQMQDILDGSAVLFVDPPTRSFGMLPVFSLLCL